MTIENTALRGERGWTLGGNPDAIVRQEKQGQAQLVNDSALPTHGLAEVAEALGIQVKGQRDGDPLFSDVTLPNGWTKRATDHDMWSELVDASGKVRANIFYKAAYYDRRAFIRLKRDE